MASFDRLSALDAVFLSLEDERNLVHVGLTAIFDKGPLRTASGALDQERLRRYTRTALASLPKFQRKLARVPWVRRPVLVDDDAVDLDYHVRFLSLVRGDDAELRDLAGRIYSEVLDRERPLWQLWFLDGLAGDRFALVCKTHHCLVDGVAGIGVFMSMLRPTPDADFEESGPWQAAQPPSGRELLRAEFGHWLDASRALLRSGAGGGVRERARALSTGLRYGLRAALPPASRTSLNPSRIGPTRSVVWVRTPLDEVRAVKRAASVKVNDVVLATVAGALRRFLLRTGEPVEKLLFRAMVPVSTHAPGSGAVDNEVSVLLVSLPLDEVSPRRRLDRIARSMLDAKSSGETEAIVLLESLADAWSFGLVTLAVKTLVGLRPYNVIVTNVPGPPVPLYLLGSRMESAYPMVPLYGNNALGVALLSYDGGLYWGFSADAAQIPRLNELEDDVRSAFAELEGEVLGLTGPRDPTP